MSIEADFTPPGIEPEAAAGSQETSFPLSNNINVRFSAYEDRLVVRSRRLNRQPINVLLTRRMTLIVLAQLLGKLPELSGLDKTPSQYWQEVLQMAHQKALESGRGTAGSKRASASAQADPANQSASRSGEKQPEREAAPVKREESIYLATALTLQRREEDIILALSGLPMPCAMTQACEREPLFAMPLRVENVHQLIQLLIDRAQEADWHLPVNLPWLDPPPDTPAATLGLVH